MKRNTQTSYEQHSARMASNDGALPSVATSDAALSRRSFLVGSAKFAALAVPAMTLLLKPQKAEAGYSRYFDYDFDDNDFDYDDDDDDDHDDLVNRPSSE